MLKQSMFILILRVMGSALSLVVTIFITRNYSIEESGFYFVNVSFIIVVATICTLGFEQMSNKYIGQYYNSGFVSKCRDFFIVTTTIVVILSFVVSFFIFQTNAHLHYFELWDYTSPLFFSLMIISVALKNYFIPLFQSINKAYIGLLFVSIFQPIIFVILATIIGLKDAYYYSSFIVVFFLVILYCRYLKSKNKFELGYSIELINRNVSKFASVSFVGVLIAHFPVLVIGFMYDSYNAALFATATKLASLVSFVLVSFNMILSPKYSYYHSIGDFNQLEYLAQRSTKYMVLISLPILLFIFSFSNEILQIFGSEYIEAEKILIVLVFAQVINACTGPVGSLLLMSKYQREFLIMQLLGIIPMLTTVIVKKYFYSHFDVIFFAISIFLGVAIQNIFGLIFVKKKMGLLTIPIGRFYALNQK